MAFKALRGLALFIVVVGLVFAGWTFLTHSPYSPWYVARWEDVGSNFQRLEYVSEAGIHVLLYSFDPEHFNLRIEQSLQPQRVKAWSQAIDGEHLLINGFYFMDDYSPAGLLISRGDSLHQQAFDLDKSGIVQLAPTFAIIDTDTAAFDAAQVTEAGQSFPLLIKQGRGSIQADSGLQARRSFVGTDENGQAYLGLVWRDDTSLFELMNILQDMEIDWHNVINLDGGPSSGLVIETNSFAEVLDSAAAVPSVIVIQPK